MKLAVLTGGSDAPGLNAVIRAVVRTAAHAYEADVVGVSHGYEGLLRPPEVWSLAPDDTSGLLRWGGSVGLGSCNRGSPFQVEGRDRSEEVLESLRWLGVDGLVVIGGDGSLGIAARLHELGVPLVGIPKSIENDLRGTGVTFGFSTAVEIATAAIDNLQMTQEAFHRVMYLEVTGRRAGWIALHAGIAGGADVILLPEVAYDPQVVADVVHERQERGRKCTIVVVAEGARAAGGPDPAPDPPAPARATPHPRAAERVAERVGALCEVDYVVTVLGHLQRGGVPNARDRVLATRFGAAAVRAAHEGQWGKMVGLQGAGATLVPLHEATRGVKAVDPEGELARTAAALGISLGLPAPAPAAGA